MGIVYVDGIARGPSGEATVRFLADSGATYSVLPSDVWQGIGLTPRRTVTFSLADGFFPWRPGGSSSILSLESSSRCACCWFSLSPAEKRPQVIQRQGIDHVLLLHPAATGRADAELHVAQLVARVRVGVDREFNPALLSHPRLRVARAG